MKKLTAIILGVCLGAAGLSGCQSGAPGASAPGGQAAESQRQEDKGQNDKGQNDSGQNPDEGQSADKGRREPQTSRSGGTVVITDHAGNQVEIPGEVNRVVVTDILPLPSIITVFLGSGEKIV